MTTHIVCLDGTNQTKAQAYPTNIAHMFNAFGDAAAPPFTNFLER